MTYLLLFATKWCVPGVLWEKLQGLANKAISIFSRLFPKRKPSPYMRAVKVNEYIVVVLTYYDIVYFIRRTTR